MKSKKYFNLELKKIFKKELRINVKEDNKIYDFVKWDSIGNFNVLLACEKKFKIKFSMKQISELKSMKKIVETLNKIEKK